jgi:hypothetical protein
VLPVGQFNLGSCLLETLAPVAGRLQSCSITARAIGFEELEDEDIADVIRVVLVALAFDFDGVGCVSAGVGDVSGEGADDTVGFGASVTLLLRQEIVRCLVEHGAIMPVPLFVEGLQDRRVAGYASILTEGLHCGWAVFRHVTNGSS